MFNFLEYGKSIERMMKEWYDHSREVLKQSTNLGMVREHFVSNVLSSFLPRSVIIGTGEIIDGEGRVSGQQDIVIYRADFPVITSFAPINTFLIEGVIATIEVKSDLSTGEPALYTAFRNVATVNSLLRAAQILSGTQDEVEELKAVNTVRTYVVGYTGWQDLDVLLKRYQQAANQTDWKGVPSIVYQPGACVLLNDGMVVPYSDENPKTARRLWLHKHYPFTMLLHHLLKAVVYSTGGSLISSPKGATMVYRLDPYFTFDPEQPFSPIEVSPSQQLG